MKRYAVLVAFAVLAIAVPFAQSSPSGTPQRLAKLEKQVRVLRAQMKTVRLQVACINGVAGVTSYGVPSNSEGYVYRKPASPTPTDIVTTGVDFTQQGETPQVLVAAVNPKCVTTRSSYSAGARKRSSGTKVTLLRLHAAR
jgi:type II secretory pathway pseudopilin PulG